MHTMCRPCAEGAVWERRVGETGHVCTQRCPEMFQFKSVGVIIRVQGTLAFPRALFSII